MRSQPKRSLTYFNKLDNYLRISYQVATTFSPKEYSSAYDPNTQTIILSHLETEKNNIDLLSDYLHEAGHVVILNGDSKKTLNEHYFNYSTDWAKCNSKKKFIDLIREEILAWEIGWDIATTLKIKIPWQDYHSIMQDSLWSYLLRIKLIPAFKGRTK